LFQTEQSDEQSVATRSAEVTDAVEKLLADDRWSWEEEGNAGKQTRDAAGRDVVVSDSNSRLDTVATMLDRLYAGDERSRAARNDDRRCWDRYADRYYDRYSNRDDVVAAWRRDALRIVPNHGVLRDGDRVVRLDGADNDGVLVYDLASCRLDKHHTANAGRKKSSKIAIWAPSHNFVWLYLRN